MRFDWEKSSYKGYYARVGPLTISVRRNGIGRWSVWEVFGSHGLCDRDFETPEQAMARAESVAESTMIRTRSAMLELKRPHGGGRVNGS